MSDYVYNIQIIFNMKNTINIAVNSEKEAGFVETIKAFVSFFTNWEIKIEYKNK